MSNTDCNYHHKVDFRAFDVMVEAIARATKEELKGAYKTAKEQSGESYLSNEKRYIWGEFAKMLGRQLRRF